MTIQDKLLWHFYKRQCWIPGALLARDIFFMWLVKRNWKAYTDACRENGIESTQR